MEKKIDIICAVRNEEGNIPLFIRNIEQLELSDFVDIGIIFVEDSSTDGTLEILRDYSHDNSAISYYSLKKGFGQTAALAFGLGQSKADAMITMDVDGGHPVHIIPAMITYYLDGAAIVQGVRGRTEKRPWHRNWGTFVFNRLFLLLSGLDTRKQNVYYRLISREIKQKLLKEHRWTYFFRIGHSIQKTALVKSVCFESDSRRFGKSKYTFPRLLSFALDAPLSVISLRRFVFIVVISSAFMLISLLKGYVFFSWCLLSLIVFIIAKFKRMSSTSILRKLEVKEQRTH